ncbi:MAG TPA: DUF3108 domain-containing protein [Steroidobacter sp.]|nr:DUF3108 domain-containing protein [Steroidobacteraceae bacterium]HLS81970.1 DUF3108 domain-containing protein [Steroidobacter sp.]
MRAMTAVIGLALGLAMHTPLADTPAPSPFTATYEVTYRGMRAGSLKFVFARGEDGRYTFETRAEPSLLARLLVSPAAVERSTMQIGPQGVRPLEWRLDDGRSGSRDGRLEFEWERGVAQGVIEGQRVELQIEPGVQDRSSIQIAVSAALLRGQEPGTVPMIDEDRIKHYTYARKEQVVLDTPFGRLDTILYESTRPGSSRVSRLWLAPQLDYAPARVEQIRKGKVETVMVLREWRSG